MTDFSVIGGAYLEVCLHPWWEQLFGSGVRAAAALSDVAEDDQLELWTWIGERDRRSLAAVASTYGFTLHAADRAQEIEFQYMHSAAEPRLHPGRPAIQQIERTSLEITNGLVFGLVEGEPSVKASRLVWDPQSGYFTRAERRKTLDAEELALVANQSELLALGRDLGLPAELRRQPKELAQQVRARLDLEAVVVKQGVQGALVVDDSSSAFIPSHPTSYVFPIGSGDVFSAVFAWEWSVNRKLPAEAAAVASKAVAFYCRSQVLPVNLERHSEEAQGDQEVPDEQHTPRVYLAGPLFSLSDNWLLTEARDLFEGMGFEVFSPKDEVGILGDEGDIQRVANADIEGLQSCDIVFAILTGMDPGTLVEIGYAHALGKPILAFAENVKRSDLTMVEGLGAEIFDDFATAVYQAGWKAFE